MTPTETPAPASGIPSEISQKVMGALQNIPEVQQLLQRQVPAVFTPVSFKGEGVDKYLGVLLDVFPTATGFGATVGPKSGSVILFDPQAISEEQVEAADQDGSLGSIALPIAPAASPEAGAAPAEAPAATPANVSAGLVAGPSAGAPAARAANLAPLPPTKQKMPGAGSIVNDLIKRPV